MAIKSSVARVFSLLRLLADPTGTHDVCSLAKHFQTSDKTIRRDIKELKHHGIQVVESIGPKNHITYSLDRSQLPPLRLNYDEALAVFLGKSRLIAFHGTGIDEASASAFEKLRLILGETEAKYVDKLSSRIHFSTQSSFSHAKADIVDSLFVAIEDSRAIFIEYQSARSTEPLNLTAVSLSSFCSIASLRSSRGFYPSALKQKYWSRANCDRKLRKSFVR